MSTDDPTDPGHATMARLLDDPAVWAEVPAGLRNRVVAAATEAAAEDALDDEPRPATRPVPLRRRRLGGRPALVAAAAAVALCLGVAGGLLLRSDDPSGAPPVEVALSGTDGAPAATATVQLRDQPSGVSVSLDVDGLGPAPEGTFYEAWLVGETGKVSAGTFHLRGDQDRIQLWLGVDPDGFEAVTVTRQPIAGGSLAEGVIVLRGELPDAG